MYERREKRGQEKIKLKTTDACRFSINRWCIISSSFIFFFFYFFSFLFFFFDVVAFSLAHLPHPLFSLKFCAANSVPGRVEEAPFFSTAMKSAEDSFTRDSRVITPTQRNPREEKYEHSQSRQSAHHHRRSPFRAPIPLFLRASRVVGTPQDSQGSSPPPYHSFAVRPTYYVYRPTRPNVHRRNALASQIHSGAPHPSERSARMEVWPAVPVSRPASLFPTTTLSSSPSYSFSNGEEVEVVDDYCVSYLARRVEQEGLRLLQEQEERNRVDSLKHGSSFTGSEGVKEEKGKDGGDERAQEGGRGCPVSLSSVSLPTPCASSFSLQEAERLADRLSSEVQVCLQQHWRYFSFLPSKASPPSFYSEKEDPHSSSPLTTTSPHRRRIHYRPHNPTVTPSILQQAFLTTGFPFYASDPSSRGGGGVRLVAQMVVQHVPTPQEEGEQKDTLVGSSSGALPFSSDEDGVTSNVTRATPNTKDVEVGSSRAEKGTTPTEVVFPALVLIDAEEYEELVEKGGKKWNDTIQDERGWKKIHHVNQGEGENDAVELPLWKPQNHIRRIVLQEEERLHQAHAEEEWESVWNAIIRPGKSAGLGGRGAQRHTPHRDTDWGALEVEKDIEDKGSKGSHKKRTPLSHSSSDKVGHEAVKSVLDYPIVKKRSRVTYDKEEVEPLIGTRWALWFPLRREGVNTRGWMGQFASPDVHSSPYPLLRFLLFDTSSPDPPLRPSSPSVSTPSLLGEEEVLSVGGGGRGVMQAVKVTQYVKGSITLEPCSSTSSNSVTVSGGGPTTFSPALSPASPLLQTATRRWEEEGSRVRLHLAYGRQGIGSGMGEEEGASVASPFMTSTEQEMPGSLSSSSSPSLSLPPLHMELAWLPPTDYQRHLVQKAHHTKALKVAPSCATSPHTTDTTPTVLLRLGECVLRIRQLYPSSPHWGLSLQLRKNIVGMTSFSSPLLSSSPSPPLAHSFWWDTSNASLCPPRSTAELPRAGGHLPPASPPASRTGNRVAKTFFNHDPPPSPKTTPEEAGDHSGALEGIATLGGMQCEADALRDASIGSFHSELEPSSLFLKATLAPPSSPTGEKADTSPSPPLRSPLPSVLPTFAKESPPHLYEKDGLSPREGKETARESFSTSRPLLPSLRGPTTTPSTSHHREVPPFPLVRGPYRPPTPSSETSVSSFTYGSESLRRPSTAMAPVIREGEVYSAFLACHHFFYFRPPPSSSRGPSTPSFSSAVKQDGRGVHRMEPTRWRTGAEALLQLPSMLNEVGMGMLAKGNLLLKYVGIQLVEAKMENECGMGLSVVVPKEGKQRVRDGKWEEEERGWMRYGGRGPTAYAHSPKTDQKTRYRHIMEATKAAMAATTTSPLLPRVQPHFQEDEKVRVKKGLRKTAMETARYYPPPLGSTSSVRGDTPSMLPFSASSPKQGIHGDHSSSLTFTTEDFGQPAAAPSRSRRHLDVASSPPPLFPPSPSRSPHVSFAPPLSRVKVMETVANWFPSSWSSAPPPSARTPLTSSSAGGGGAGIFIKAQSQGSALWSLWNKKWWLTLRQHSGLLWSYHPSSSTSTGALLSRSCSRAGSSSNCSVTSTTIAGGHPHFMSHDVCTTGHWLSFPAREIRGWWYTGNEEGCWRCPSAKWFAVLSAELSAVPPFSSSFSSSTTSSNGGKRPRWHWSLFLNIGWMSDMLCSPTRLRLPFSTSTVTDMLLPSNISFALPASRRPPSCNTKRRENQRHSLSVSATSPSPCVSPPPQHLPHGRKATPEVSSTAPMEMNTTILGGDNVAPFYTSSPVGLSMWPKASLGFSLVSSAPRFLLDAFNNGLALQQEFMFCWSIESFRPFQIKARGSPHQVGPVWRKGPHEFFEHCRVGVTWKW